MSQLRVDTSQPGPAIKGALYYSVLVSTPLAYTQGEGNPLVVTQSLGLYLKDTLTLAR